MRNERNDMHGRRRTHHDHLFEGPFAGEHPRRRDPRRGGPHGPFGGDPFGGPRRGDHPMHRGMHRGRGRAQRGDVRAAVLRLLADEPMHGYQLMQAIAERTGGIWRPSPGAIYPTIAQLEDEGLVTVDKDGGRKLVSLTDAGREYLADPANQAVDPFAARTPEAGAPDLRAAVRDLQNAVRAVAVSGDDALIASAYKTLIDTRKSLYLLLAAADDDSDET
ncbi:PadR family transcriptional regulator [Rhodococcus yananensis]|uniref:PadR family transcriptional regulator n=1 Tax=Rhodococcus yananensis TaxID=2879464 RepID=UPI001CF8B151|nr:PadR family transcriptional regulator [Rhodococcus yananensis]